MWSPPLPRLAWLMRDLRVPALRSGTDASTEPFVNVSAERLMKSVWLSLASAIRMTASRLATLLLATRK